MKELRVPGCTSLPCIVYRGSNYSIEYDFTASKFMSLLVKFIRPSDQNAINYIFN